MDEQERDKDPTSPPADSPAEATAPPGNGDIDDEAVEKEKDKLGEAGAGH